MFSPDECECSKSEIDLFSTPPINTSMEHGKWVEFRPISSLTNDGPIEFNVTATDEDYTDIGRTYLYIQATILKDTAAHEAVAEVRGGQVEDANRVAPVNLWMHSLFQQVDIKLNNTIITPSTNTYPYRAYLEKLLSYGSAGKETQMSMEGWFKDDANKFANTTVDGNGNKGFKARHDLIAQRASVEFTGRLHCDLFQQDRYLPNGMEMNVSLVRSKDAFNIQHAAEDHTSYRVHIEKAVLCVRRVKLNPSIHLEHEKLLNDGTNAKYPLRRVNVKSFTIPANNRSCVQDNVIQGQLPRRVVLGFVNHDNYNGTTGSNPFEFNHFNLNYLSLYVDGEPIPSQPFRPNFTSNQYMKSYRSLFEGTGMLYDDRGNGITRQDYPNGYMLHVFDLSNDMAEGNHMDPIKHGNLRVEVQFAEALAAVVNVVLYCEYDNILQIDRARNVITDY